MQLIVPMAGRGKRFSDAGFTVPKPFIDVEGSWIVDWALKGFDLSRVSRVVFILLREHEELFDASKKLKEKYGEKVECVLVDTVTEGAVCTVLLARDFLATDEDVVVKDSDGYLQSDIEKKAAWGREHGVSGILTTTALPGDRWSFARTDETGRVVEVAEKRRISDNAIVGQYYFAHGRDLLSFGERIVREDKRAGQGEFYMSTIYQEMIADGLDVRIDEASEFWDLGTPDALAQFLNRHER